MNILEIPLFKFLLLVCNGLGSTVIEWHTSVGFIAMLATSAPVLTAGHHGDILAVSEYY